MMKVADTNGDGAVSLDEFITVMNSAHCCEEICGQMSLPRILIKKNESFFQDQSAELPSDKVVPAILNEAQFSGRSKSGHFGNELHSTRKLSTNIRRLSVNSKKLPKKLNELKTWMSESDETSRRATLPASSSFDSSFCGSSQNSLKKRRKSSISRTLRNGRDALIATARNLRRISR